MSSEEQTPETKPSTTIQNNVQEAVAPTQGTVISKFSLQGFQKKKQADLIQKERLNQTLDGPVKEINYQELLNYWQNFAKKINQEGEKIMYTYMVLDTPKLEGNTIKLEFPNQSSKEDFYKRQGALVSYLRENLENFEITIDISIAEEIKQKYAFTPEEKFEKLKNINPAIELMRKMFELEIS